MFRVTIREIHYEEKFGQTIEVSVRDATECLVVAPTLPSGRRLHKSVAAEGWAKAVGIARRTSLSEFRAPQHIIEMCTSAKGFLRYGKIDEAPTFLLDFTQESGSHWLLDNRVESWLISVEPIAVPANPALP